jgi:regulator of sigma E protease
MAFFSEILTHPIPAVVIMLGVLVFFHELGHYLVGKWAGIGVEVFSIGFGPRLIKFQGGETEYRIGILPLGGFVKFAGASRQEDVPPHFRGREMFRAPVWKRFAAVAAGPIANFLLAIAAYTWIGGQGIPHPPPVVGDVRLGSPAEKAGILSGDQIVAIDESPVRYWEDIRDAIAAAPGKAISLRVLRRGAEIVVTLVPESVEMMTVSGKKKAQGRAGIAVGNTLPVITVDPNSPAAQAGLVTGNRIVQIEINDKPVAIDNMSRFWAELALATEAKVPSISLRIRDEDLAGNGVDAPPITGMERVVTLNLAPGSSTENHSITQLGESLGARLGIHGSQLTIKSVESPLTQILKEGDRIVLWNKVKILDIYNFSDLLRDIQSPKVVLDVVRAGKMVAIEVPLVAHEVQKPEGVGTAYSLPVEFLASLNEPEAVQERYERFADAFQFGVKQTWKQAGSMIEGLRGLITGDVPVQSLGGPILIAKVAGDSAKMGLVPFLITLALISINLGLVNLLPIPVLDGGQLVLLATEGARRRPLSESAVENFQKIGFVMVLSLIVLAMFNDLSRFWTTMVRGIAEMFQ